VLNHSQPDLTEIALSFSTPMKAIHSALLVAMNTCLNELKKSCHLINEDVIPLTLEKCMLKSFDFTLRRHLEADWHRLSLQTKQLISDLEPIRKLMDFLLQYDAIDFYRYLLGLKSEMAQQMSLITMSSSNNVSVWWSTHAADVIFTKAKERVYTLRPFPPGPSTPYSEFVQKRLHIHKTLIPTLEIPPKFTAFRQIIDELSTEFHRQPHNDVSLSRETTAEDSTCRRVLVLVKTERSAAQVRELLTHNPRVVMEQRYRVHVSEQCAKLRSQISANLGRPVDTRIEMAADPLQIGLTVDELKRLQEETALMLAEVLICTSTTFLNPL
jgi:DNA excision repair protein ERCC-4